MPIDRIVIAGGGVVGWMAASMVARALGPDFCDIVLIDSGTTDVSLGYSTRAEPMLPATVEASALHGYDENLLIAATRATFSLGTALGGWGGDGAAFLPHGALGTPMGAVAFHQLIARMRAGGAGLNLANYSLEALCAQAGRFARPSPADRSIHATLAYGLHVDTQALAQAMHGDAAARGVQIRNADIAGVEREAGGRIDAIVLGNGDRVRGDLFIDCLGPGSLLAGEAAIEDWSHWLPINRLHETVSALGAAPPAYTVVAAIDGGWRRSVPLQGSMAEMTAWRAQELPDEAGGAPFAAGRRIAPWQANCVAIGGAAVMIDPIGAAPLHLAQSALLRLIRLLPADRAGTVEAAEYNRETVEELDRARDYAIAHYACLPAPDGSARAALPEPLAHKIALYESCGRVPMLDGEIYEEAAWIALFDALGLRAHRHDALAGGLSDDAIAAHFDKLRALMLRAIAAMPPHDAYLASIRR